MLDGGRLPIHGPGQLPGPGGDFQAPGLAGGMGLYLSLMGRCWAQRPEDRPTFSDIITGLRCVRWLLGVALASRSDSWNCSCQQQKCFNSQPLQWQLSAAEAPRSTPPPAAGPSAMLQADAGIDRAQQLPGSGQWERASLSRQQQSNCATQ